MKEQRQNEKAKCQGTCKGLFPYLLIFYEILMVALFGLIKYPTSNYGLDNKELEDDLKDHLFLFHQIVIDINVFVLIGFSFLIVYLRFHRWGALGYTFFAYVTGMKIYTLFSALWHRSWLSDWDSKFDISLFEIIGAQKCSLAIIITLGSLIGKVDIFQVFLLSFIESIIYSLNEAILFYQIQVLDIGGAMSIHTFASVFGLFTTWIYSNKSNADDNPNSMGNHNTTTISFIGTFFVWIFFPAFNSINPKFQDEYNNIRFISMANTFWSILASTSISFVLSMLLKNGKFSIEYVQNASISGGIAIAASCNMFSFPFPALLVGLSAGIISCISYNFLRRLMNYIHIFETRGIFHVHGIHGILGGLISVITTATLCGKYFGSGTKIQESMLFDRSCSTQSGFQLVGLAISFAIGALGGICVGVLFLIWKVVKLPEDTFCDHFSLKMMNEISTSSQTLSNQVASKIPIQNINEFPVSRIVISH